MIIETEYNIGDRLWAMVDNRAAEVVVYHIGISVGNTGELTLRYSIPIASKDDAIIIWNYSFIVVMNGKKVTIGLENLFKTKQELLDSL